MMRVADFEIDEGLMIVVARITGTEASCLARLVVDTGAAVSSVAPDVCVRAGYRPSDLLGRTRVITAVGLEHGRKLRLQRVTVLGRTFSPLEVNMFEIAYRGALDGVLGLDVLNRFDYEVRPRSRHIITKPHGG